MLYECISISECLFTLSLLVEQPIHVHLFGFFRLSLFFPYRILTLSPFKYFLNKIVILLICTGNILFKFPLFILLHFNRNPTAACVYLQSQQTKYSFDVHVSYLFHEASAIPCKKSVAKTMFKPISE